MKNFSFFALAADEDPQKKKIEKKQEKKVEGAVAGPVSSASGDEEEELTIDIQPRVERRSSSNQLEQLRKDTGFFLGGGGGGSCLIDSGDPLNAVGKGEVKVRELAIVKKTPVTGSEERLSPTDKKEEKPKSSKARRRRASIMVGELSRLVKKKEVEAEDPKPIDPTARRRASIMVGELPRLVKKKEEEGIVRSKSSSKLRRQPSASFLAAQKLASEDESEEESKKSSSGRKSTSSMFFMGDIGGVKDAVEQSTMPSTALSRSSERRRSLSPTFLEALRYAEEEIQSLTESAKEEEKEDLKIIAEERQSRSEQQKKLLKDKREEFACDQAGYERDFAEKEKRLQRKLDPLVKLRAYMESYLEGVRPLRFSARLYFETPDPSNEEVQAQLQRINQDIERRRVQVEQELQALKRVYRISLEDLFLRQRLFEERQTTSESEIQSDESRELRRRRSQRKKNISDAQRALKMLREKERILTEGSESSFIETHDLETDTEEKKQVKEEKNLGIQRSLSYRGLSLLARKHKEERFLLGRLQQSRWERYVQEQESASANTSDQSESSKSKGRKSRRRRIVKRRNSAEIRALHQQEIEEMETRHQRERKNEEERKSNLQPTGAGIQQLQGAQTEGPDPTRNVDFLPSTLVLTPLEARQRAELEELERFHQRQHEAFIQARSSYWSLEVSLVQRLTEESSVSGSEEDLFRRRTRHERRQMQARHQHEREEENKEQRSQKDEQGAGTCQDHFFERGQGDDDEGAAGVSGITGSGKTGGTSAVERASMATEEFSGVSKSSKRRSSQGSATSSGKVSLRSLMQRFLNISKGSSRTSSDGRWSRGASAASSGEMSSVTSTVGSIDRPATCVKGSRLSISSVSSSDCDTARSANSTSLEQGSEMEGSFLGRQSRSNSVSSCEKLLCLLVDQEMSEMSEGQQEQTATKGERSCSNDSDSSGKLSSLISHMPSNTSQHSFSSGEEILCLLVDQEMREKSEVQQDQATTKREDASQAERVVSDISKSEEGRCSSASGESSLDEHSGMNRAVKKQKKQKEHGACRRIGSSEEESSTYQKTRKKKAKAVIRKERMQAQRRLSTSSSTKYAGTSVSMELSSSLSLPSEDLEHEASSVHRHKRVSASRGSSPTRKTTSSSSPSDTKPSGVSDHEKHAEASDHEKSTDGREGMVLSSHDGIGYLGFYFSSDGEPPENNEAVPDFLFYEHNQDGDTSSEELSVQIDEGNQNITESDEDNIESISAIEEETSSEEESDDSLLSEVMPHAEILNATPDAYKNSLCIDYNRAGQEESLRELQQMFFLSMQDMQDALISLFLQAKIKKQKQESIVSLYASMKRGLDSLHESTNSYGSQVGCIVEASKNSKVGFAYNYAMNRTKDSLKKEKGIVVQGYAKSLVHTHIFSSIVALNSNNIGFTGYLEGSYGIGKVHNNRYVWHKAMFVGTKGHTDIQLTGLSTRMGYALACPSWMVLTPYVEVNYLKSKGKPYKEQRGFLPAKIVMNKEQKYEILMGIDAQVFVYEKIQVHAWLEGVLGKQKHQGMFLDIDNIYAPTISTPAEKKRYKNIVLGFSIDTYLTQSFGFGLYSSIKGKYRRVEQGSIGLRTWYDF